MYGKKSHLAQVHILLVFLPNVCNNADIGKYYFMEKLLIIDGNNLAFRAFYALPILTTADGQPTNAIFGFVNMLLKVLEEYNPTHAIIAFDAGKTTFRNQIFADYKGTRKETPDELRSQFPLLKELLHAMNICVVEKQGIEADDIIGTYAKAHTCPKIILSGDRDLLQLIDKNTEVWLSQKGISEIKKMNEDLLMQTYNISPPQIIELKALMGDASDNIPGVSGIGEKTATNLLKQFDDVNNLYANLSSPFITPKLRQKLEQGEQNAFMSKTLATIKTDCEISTDLSACKLTLPFPTEVTEMLESFNMTSLLKRKQFFQNIGTPQPTSQPLVEKTISSLAEIKNILPTSPKVLAVDISDALRFSFAEDAAFVVESEFTLFCQPPQTKDCLELLKPYLQDENLPKVVADIKAQMHELDKFNIQLKGEIFDVALGSYLLGNKLPVGKDLPSFFALKQTLEGELARLNLDKLYYDIELPLENVLYDMENAGFMVDKNALVALSATCESKLQALSAQIFEYAGREFNINSPKQLSEVLFDELHLPANPGKSTGVDVLTDLSETHPIIQCILDYRKTQKLKSTYVDAFLSILQRTNSNIIHTIFNQTLTSTGRLSSSEPNLQNLPVKDDDGKEIRKAFISRFADGKLVSADYNQIELRLLAHLSGDSKMIDAFNQNQDIHTRTAMEVFALEKSSVTPQIRRHAKAVNFGIIYGISGTGLARGQGLTRKDAQAYINRYFEIYPNIKKFLDDNVEFAKKYGYAKTMFGRRRKIPELKSENHQTRLFGSRVAKNMPMQGSASDIIKLAMLKVAQELKSRHLKSQMILQIHDELVLDCPANEVAVVQKLLKEAMENVVALSVKLPVDVQSGKNYFEI